MKNIICLTLILFLAESCHFSKKDDDISQLGLSDLENGLVKLYIPKTIWSQLNETVEHTDLIGDSIAHYSFSNQNLESLDVSSDVNLSNSDLKYLLDKETEAIAAVNINNKIYYTQILDLGGKKVGVINYKKVKDGKILSDNWSALGLSDSRNKIVRVRITYSEGAQIKDSVSKILSSINIAE